MSSEDNTDTAGLLASRESVYGNRVDNMTRVAEMWNGYLGTDIITPADVAMMFTLYKAYRFKVTPDYSDNINDVLGYAEMVREVQEATGGLIHAETVKEYLEKKNRALRVAHNIRSFQEQELNDAAPDTTEPDPSSFLTAAQVACENSNAGHDPAIDNPDRCVACGATGLAPKPRHPYENVERDAERDSMEAWRNRKEEHNG